jgi:hypothetical protein
MYKGNLPRLPLQGKEEIQVQCQVRGLVAGPSVDRGIAIARDAS